MNGMEGRPRHGVAYLRVSGSEQERGYGLDAQRELIVDWAAAHDVTIVAVYSDVISGATPPHERAGMVDALALLREQPGMLLVARLDRLARDVVAQEVILREMSRQGCPVVSVSEPAISTDTDDPQRNLVRVILGAVNEYERHLIRARMEAGKRLKKQRGGWVNGPAPYGWQLDHKELVKHPTEWPHIVQMVAWKRQGNVTARGLAALCNARGVPTRFGGPWSKDTANRAVVRAESVASRHGFDLNDPDVPLEPAPDDLPPDKELDEWIAAATGVSYTRHGSAV